MGTQPVEGGIVTELPVGRMGRACIEQRDLDLRNSLASGAAERQSDPLADRLLEDRGLRLTVDPIEGGLHRGREQHVRGHDARTRPDAGRQQAECQPECEGRPSWSVHKALLLPRVVRARRHEYVCRWVGALPKAINMAPCLTVINPRNQSYPAGGKAGAQSRCNARDRCRLVGGHQVKTTQKRHPISLFIRSALRSPGLAAGSTATGCALLLAASGGVARAADQGPAQDQAQAQGQEQLQEVVITGIRAGIESAIKTKEKSDLIQETISAEDIGKLPDVSIAESLARMPGVTTQRNNLGEATSVSIRGLGPDFNGYLMNGREQTSTLDSRAVDLSVYPAELIAGATVYKSGDAALMTAGLAGTIDQRLVDPLSYEHLIARGSYEGDRFNEGVSGQPVGKGKRYSLSFIDQFADRKLGLAIGFVHSDHDSAALQDSSWGTTGYQ